MIRNNNTKHEEEGYRTRPGTLSTAVIGYGHFGRLHARKYCQLEHCRLSAVIDPDPGRRELAAAECAGVRCYPSLQDLLQTAPPDIASVAVPASLHYSVARALLSADVQLLVEKPLATEPWQARQLAHLAHNRGLLLQPGHLERFNDTLTHLRTGLSHWDYLEARRLCRWNDRANDVDVVMDLMIHDVDMLLALERSALSRVRARGLKVYSRRWDVVSAELTFASGRRAQLTASRVSLHPERNLHVFADNACALTDLGQGDMMLYRRRGRGLELEQRSCGRADPLGLEVGAFVEAVRSGGPAAVDAADGCRAVDVARRIIESVRRDDILLERIQRTSRDPEDLSSYLQDAIAP